MRIAEPDDVGEPFVKTKTKLLIALPIVVLLALVVTIYVLATSEKAGVDALR